jgi:hypothetical protein
MSLAPSQDGTDADYSFELTKAVVFDAEVYPDHWCFGFYGPVDAGNLEHCTVDGDRDALHRTLDRLASRERTLVGYNSSHYDIPIARVILAGLDPYTASRAIVSGAESLPSLSRLPAFPSRHIDLAARLRRGGRFPSLKTVAANLGRPLLRELPYDPASILSDEEWAGVLRYNRVDLEHTWALLEFFAPELEALGALSSDLGRDLRSVPTPRVVETVFIDVYRNEHGTEPTRPETPHEVVYRPVAGVREPRTAGAREWHRKIANTPLRLIPHGEHNTVDVPTGRFEINGVLLKAGSGGLHSQDRPRLYRETRHRLLIEVDVVSYYPNLIAKKGITSCAYGDTAAATYRDMLTRRLDIRRQAKKAADPCERHRLEVQANALKLILNSTFGKLGDPYSTLYDPAVFLAVTLSGQLILIDLIERLTQAGIRVAAVNTDGLIIRPRRGNHTWRKILEEWQCDTEMTLEVEPLSRFVTLATNRYASLSQRGNVKRKGDGLKGGLSPLAAPNNLVIADAVCAALLHDVPPEVTIAKCTDPVRFCSVVRRSGKVQRLVLEDPAKSGETTERELPAVCRFYKARDSMLRIRRYSTDGATRSTTSKHAQGVALALDLTNGTPPFDIDHSWFTSQARREIQRVETYLHRSARLLQDHTLALRVHNLGLVPCPKQGKNLPPGSNAAHPSYLFDWRRYSTIGTFTGPAVGILVLDVDDPAKFRMFVDRHDSPLLRSRWGDLENCLVSYHGEATAEGVRTGRDRGKLIFQIEAKADQSLVDIPIDRWKKKYGVEVFYGKGIPSILGLYSGSDTYRLDGTLTRAPDWLVEELGKTTTKRVKTTRIVAKAESSAPAAAKVLTESVAEETHDELIELLVQLAPELGRDSVGWSTKDLGNDRVILVGRCPFEHESGTSNDRDLSAGLNEDGIPYIACKHATCTRISDIARELRARRWHPVRDEAVDAPDIDPTPIAKSVLRDLQDRSVSQHIAPTGSGKSYAAAQVAALRCRRRLATLIAEPTIRLAEETIQRLHEIVPDAVAAGAVAPIYARTLIAEAEWSRGDDEDTGDCDDDEAGYPIDGKTRIVVCTHAQLGRRGWSKFLRGIWSALGLDKKTKRPEFAIVIDEASEFIRASRHEVELEHRTAMRRYPDHTGGSHVHLDRCPKSSRSGNCHNCTLVSHGGVASFNSYGIRELCKPPRVVVDGNETRYVRALAPLELEAGELQLGEKLRVGDTTFAAEVLGFRSQPIDELSRRTAPVFLFVRPREEEGQEPESLEDVLGHMLQFAQNPVVTWEHPIDAEGGLADVEALRDLIEREQKNWDAGVVFPHLTCAVPRLRFADMYGFEQLRRFAKVQKIGIAFLTAHLNPDDAEMLRTIWPSLVLREHPYGERRIRQVAVVSVQGYQGGTALIGPNGKLVKAPLESYGRGLVFVPIRRLAERLYKVISLKQPTARLAVENSERLTLDKTMHHPGNVGTYVSYSRGVLGLGANVSDVRHVIADALAFRSIAGFTPSTITAEEFARMRTEERKFLILQNLGRALRGEEGKTVVLILLNADDELIESILTANAILDGSELPPVHARGRNLHCLVEQAGRWLAAGGGDWPEGDKVSQEPKKMRAKRVASETILAKAEAAITDRMTWRQFQRKCHPERHLQADTLEALKVRFQNRDAPRIAGSKHVESDAP